MKKLYAVAAVLFTGTFGFGQAHAQTNPYQTYTVQSTTATGGQGGQTGTAPYTYTGTYAGTGQSVAPAQPSGYDTAPSFFAPISDRLLTDPLYLPLKGQVYGESSYAYTNETGNNYKGGVQTNSFTANDNLITQLFEYGVTDDFSLHAAMSAGFDSRNTANGTGGGSSEGFSDPTFGFTYRVLDQRQYPFTVDLAASYAPDVFTAKSPGDDKDGAIARGGQLAIFSATVGREMRNFTAALVGTAEWSGHQDSADLTSNANNDSLIETDSFWTFGGGLETQTRITNQFSFNAGLAYAAQTSHDVYNDVVGDPRTAEGLDTLSFTASLNYSFIPNRLAAILSYEYNDYMNDKSNYPLAANDTAVQDFQGNVIGAHLEYVFN
jgi:hypothetical protein